MCGIVAVTGREGAADLLIEGLRRVEYRGYDSAGIAVHDGARTHVVKAVGALDNLRDKLAAGAPAGATGVGHTRWATHGAVTEANAHPHVQGAVSLVHNGIIENAGEIRARAAAEGARLLSDTDSEAIAWRLDRALQGGADPFGALHETLADLVGAFAFAALVVDRPGLVLAARRGCPLALAHEDGAAFVGSDALALSPFTSRVTFLEEGDRAVLTPEGFAVRDAQNRLATRKVHAVSASPALAEKGEYAHFMEKEIFEQPEAVARTVGVYLRDGEDRVAAPPQSLAEAAEIVLLGCGTAYYAALIAAQWFEAIAKVPARAETASEFRYRDPLIRPGTVALAVSQSGETADTLSALDLARARGATTAALVNVETSTMARTADVVLATHAGPEIGVASTKAFTCQLAALAATAAGLADARGAIDAAARKNHARALMAAPRLIADALALDRAVKDLAQKIRTARDVLFIGRGGAFPLALEGALKLKEISYIHAEGYAAGELKHGPIALIDEDVPVIVVAPSDAVFAKTLSNAREAAARGGRVILLSDAQGVAAAGGEFEAALTLPAAVGPAAAMVGAIPLQLLAYHVASAKGTDVDRPRNLAKSVTVE